MKTRFFEKSFLRKNSRKNFENLQKNSENSVYKYQKIKKHFLNVLEKYFENIFEELLKKKIVKKILQKKSCKKI